MNRFCYYAASFLMMAGNSFAQTTVTLSASRDAAIGYHDGANTAGNNYGSAIQNAAFWIPSVAAPPPGVNANRASIDFNLTVIPVGATITSAYLNLYAIGPLGSVNGHFGNNACFLERITQNWGEFTATWNNQPNSTTQNSVILPQSTNSLQDYLNINVLNLVQDMINNPSAGFGMKLKLVSEVVSNGLLFCSKDHVDPTKHPTLVITYITCSQIVQPVQSNLAICSGSSASIFATGPGSNNALWYTSPNSSVTVGSGSVFTTPVLLALSTQSVYNYYIGACDGEVRPSINVTVNPLPVVAVIRNKESICHGESITFTATGTTTYSWTDQSFLISTSSVITLAPPISTNYVLTGINAYGCTATISVNVIVSPCTGIKDENSGTEVFSIFPNPSTGSFKIVFSSSAFAEHKLLIADAHGRLMRAYDLEPQCTIFDINDIHLTPGIYFCRLMANDQLAAVKKIIISK